MASLVCSLTASGHNCNFFPCKRKFYWKGNRNTNKECCIAVVAGLLRNKHIKQTFSIRLKRVTSAGVSISCESCITCACVRSHSITTHRIHVTAVRVGTAFVDIYIQTCCCNYKNLKASSLHIYAIFIIFALEFWGTLQGNVFEKPIHKIIYIEYVTRKNYVFTEKKLYLQLYSLVFSLMYF